MKKKVKVKRQVENKEVVEEIEQEADIASVEEKRSALLKELQSKLLTKQQMKQGGRDVRRRANSESAYQANLDEINALGKEIGLGPIGLGDIRR
jgi:hypothetical protein